MGRQWTSGMEAADSKLGVGVLELGIFWDVFSFQDKVKVHSVIWIRYLGIYIQFGLGVGTLHVHPKHTRVRHAQT
jgi:hypothetical protein